MLGLVVGFRRINTFRCSAADRQVSPTMSLVVLLASSISSWESSRRGPTSLRCAGRRSFRSAKTATLGIFAERTLPPWESLRRTE